MSPLNLDNTIHNRTMLELLIHRGPKTELIESPIPTPNDDQVVIKVMVSGSNPKDWKRPEWFDVHINQGDDISGIVHSTGKNVTEFKVCEGPISMRAWSQS